jgi:AraC family transcriptional regulator
LRDEGVTFNCVFSEVRVRHATTLLADPDRRVIDVALEVGFENQTHFTRAFRKHTGLTPRAYRHSLAA